MKIVLAGEDEITLNPLPGPLTIEAPDAKMQYSPFHMLGSALAICTHSVLSSWGSHAGLSTDDLTISISWSFAEKPHRVGSIRMALSWPSLPAERVEVARRAALLCPIHTTLSHPTSIEIAGGA
ncbi:MAG TPA: OsmC family protein [Gemmatimonadaceae bacterium]|nr:OsmC family protein [Gemmatimonadaceae bacterium]